VAHPNARLSVFGRQLLVTRVTVLGWPACEAARQLGVSRATAYKWLRRYRLEGQAGSSTGAAARGARHVSCRPSRPRPSSVPAPVAATGRTAWHR